MLVLTSAIAIALLRQDAFDLQIKALGQKRAVFQAMKFSEPLYGGDAGTEVFYPAGRADCRYLSGCVNDFSGLVLLKEVIVDGKAREKWRLKLKEQRMKGKPQPGELNLYLWNEGLTFKKSISDEIRKDLSSPLPLAVYDNTGPIEVLWSYFMIDGKTSAGEPADMAGAENKKTLRQAYPISTFEIAWLKSHPEALH